MHSIGQTEILRQINKASSLLYIHSFAACCPTGVFSGGILHGGILSGYQSRNRHLVPKLARIDVRPPWCRQQSG